MDFTWLKAYTPRSLMGRAALILLLPVITIQLVVGVVFIQRHYENVTRQMTTHLALDFRYLAEVLDSGIVAGGTGPQVVALEKRSVS